MNKDKPATAETDIGPQSTEGDVVSDPGKENADTGEDWSDEGGATPSGPAEDTDAS